MIPAINFIKFNHILSKSGNAALSVEYKKYHLRGIEQEKTPIATSI